jgi:adenosylhomocysteinase
VLGYGGVGKGSAASLRQEGMIVKITEIDPICAMQACMDGFEVVSPFIAGVNTGETSCINTLLMGTTDIIVITAGNTNMCDENMLKTIKYGALVCNIGHFEIEIDTAFMRAKWKFEEVTPQVHKVHRAEAP